MARLSKTGGKASKEKTRKAANAKRGVAPVARRRRSSPAAGQETEVARLNRELKEAFERQAVTSGILQVISDSAADSQLVFDTIAKNAARLCKAQFCHVFRFENGLVHFAAQYGYSSTPQQFLTNYPLPPGRTSAATRSILTGDIEVIPDVLADPRAGVGSVPCGRKRHGSSHPKL